MLVLKGTKSEVISAAKAASSETVFFLKSKPTVPMLSELVNSTRIEKLIISKKLYLSIPKRALLPLEKVGVRIEVSESRRGRPPVHSSELISQAKAMFQGGNRPDEIAAKLGMPIRTVYYHLRKERKRRAGSAF